MILTKILRNLDHPRNLGHYNSFAKWLMGNTDHPLSFTGSCFTKYRHLLLCFVSINHRNCNYWNWKYSVFLCISDLAPENSSSDQYEWNRRLSPHGHHHSYIENQHLPKLQPVSMNRMVLTLMLVVAKLASTKKHEKWLKPWHMVTHLTVLSKSSPMNTNMTGFRWFSKT